MSRVYLISGLGADSRLFKNIKLPDGYEPVLIDWLPPESSDTLTTYAQKLIEHNEITKGEVVIGVSLGGMLSVEIAKKVKLDKVILVSSIKTARESPWYFRLFRNLPLYKAIPGMLMTQVGFMIKPVFGKMTADDLALFKSMLRNSSPVFLKWAMRAVLYWKNDVVLPNLYHIIGNKDLVFPHQNIKSPTAIVQGGTHIMVFDKAAEINRILSEILIKNK